jgi:hypothetical protein
MGGHSLAQHPMQDLASGRSRHLLVVDKSHRLRTLVSCDTATAPIKQFGRIGARIVVQDNDRHDGFAPLFVRHPDHRNIANAGVRTQNGLDFGRVNILATADDHIAFAIYQKNITVRVAPGQIPHGAPIAAKCLSGLFRVLPVAIKDIRSSRIELSDLTIGDLVTVSIEYPN